MTDTFTSPGSADVPRPRPAEPVIAPPIVPPAAAPTSPVPPLAPVAPPTPVASAAAAPTAAVRSGVGPRFVVGAVLVATVLASSGTYVAMRAADAGRGTASDTPVLTAANGTAAPGTPAPATQAPATQAPATQAPATPVPTTAPPAAGNGGGGTTPIVDIVKAVSPAVVTIVAEGVTEADPITGMTTQGTATGSGVIFDANGLILTNHHVVAGDPQSLSVHLKDGRSLPATIYGIDTMTDLAIVKVKETGLPTAPIGDSSTIQVGQTAIAIGSPLGTFTDSVTSGIISAVGRTIPVEDSVLSNLIQTDTAINPGNSGGPLLDPSGTVIGINTAVAGDSQGIGFAIPIDIARPLLAQASAGQPLARPWLGVQFVTIDPTTKAEYGLSADSGAWIPDHAATSTTNGAAGSGAAADTSIVAGGPAATAGLRPGDVITAVDGITLDAAHPLDLIVSQLAPGQTVALTVLRDAQTTTLELTLGTRPASS